MRRRDMLKGIAAASLMSLGEPLAQLAKGEVSRAGTRKLTIYFHGPFAFVLHSGNIVALTPRVATHAYKLSIDGKEGYFPGGTYNLDKVTGGSYKPAIDKSSNAVIEAAHFGIQAIDPKKRSYCSITLPFPHRFTPVQLLHADPVFSGPAGDELNSYVRQVPNIVAFDYDVSNDEAPRIEGLMKPDLPGNRTSLHLISEPIQMMGEEHTVAAFKALVDLFPGLRLGLSRDFVLNARVVDTDGTPVHWSNRAGLFRPIGIRIVNCMAPGFCVVASA